MRMLRIDGCSQYFKDTKKEAIHNPAHSGNTAP